MKNTAEIIYVKKEMSQLVTTDNQSLETLNTPNNYTDLLNLMSYNGYHARCIKAKATMTAGLGYEIVNHINPSAGRDADYNKLKEFIESQIGYSGQLFTETLSNFQTDYEIFGNAYFEIVRNVKGEVAELYHLPSKDIKVKLVGKDIHLLQEINVNKVEFTPYGKRVEGKNEYISAKNYSPNSYYYGVPDYLGAIGAIVQDKLSSDYNTYKFLNKSIPESIIIVKGMELSAEARDSIKTFFEQQYKGVNNTARSLILHIDSQNGQDCSIDVKPIDTSNKEGAYRGLRTDLRDEIISTHGVPKRILGIATAGSLGGTGEGKNQLKIFQDCIIEPRQKKLEYLLNNKIVKEGLNINDWEIQLNRLYVEDATGDANYYTALINAGVLSPDEARDEIGYKAREDKEKVAQTTNNLGVLTETIKELRKQITGLEYESLE